MATEHFTAEPFEIYSDPSASTVPEVDMAITVHEAHVEHKVAVTEIGVMESVEREEVVSRRPIRSHNSSPRNSSGPSGDEAIFDDDAPRSSPSTSHYSDDDRDEGNDEDELISELLDGPPDLVDLSAAPCTPVKHPSPFRNPSSVRAMQMDTTPPFHTSPYASSPRSPRYKLPTPSRSGTPRSQGRKPRSVKKEYPLVLLHVTLLPVIMPCSMNAMTAILPPHIIESYNLLRDKINDTVLERGILLPHPKDDYELVEERLLESLELRTPRITRCGHFYPPEDEAEEDEEEAEIDVASSEDGDVDICDDCGRRVRDGRLGSGKGSKRWSIKIYAANGLMRAGAWGAAWREMERVDVEVEPWIPEDLKRELQVRREEEEAEAKRGLHHEDAHVEPETSLDGPETHFPLPVNAQQAPPLQQTRRQSEEQERQRLREIYGGENIEHLMPGQFTETPPRTRMPSATHVRDPHDIPLSTLVTNYLFLLASDRRNVAIALLSLLVLVLSAGLSASSPSATDTSYLTPHAISSSPVTTSMAATGLPIASSIHVSPPAPAASAFNPARCSGNSDTDAADCGTLHPQDESGLKPPDRQS
ncbi:MAG: hypothetical protein M1838_000195 [Thelocarpon superellum]|nr:MAG: hypothetical protein M1838_000195 [Thelocarpon superellum]